jgi:tetratricopeptide (TPR) repeat protein
MKMISKISKLVLALIFIGSSVFAQSLADAKKAIDAEQYQKAKSMLKNLTTTQADKDENFFYLGWVYILQDYPDSAKTVFTKGISINPKSALNYAGLGAAAFVDKDRNTATTNFNQAVALAGKNSKPYVYVGKAYLLKATEGKVDAADANAAIAVLNKGKAINPKDAELLVALGDAYRTQLKSTEALGNYQTALELDPKLAIAKVATGVLWRYADNYEDSERLFKEALAIDPNFGPAYREWAETDIRWSLRDPKMASAKVKEGLDNYRKYIALTDMSVESRMRYADFLLYAGDFKALQTEAAALSKLANGNLRTYRYLAYAAFENKDYPAALTAMNTWVTKADPKRVIPRDYLYLGRIQIANQQDSLGIHSLQKAYDLDTTQADVYVEIAKSLYANKKYEKAGDAYMKYVTKARRVSLNDYLAAGRSYYIAYEDQLFSTAKPKPTPDSTLLIKADTAFSYIEHKATAPVAPVVLLRARVKDYMDKDRNNIKGLAKPYYEQYIQLMTANPPTDEKGKKTIAEAYAYLGLFYQYKEKDDAKATESFTKAKEFDPNNKQAAAFFARKSGTKGK